MEQRQRWNREAGRAKSTTARAKKQVLAAGMELREVDGALCQALQDVLAGTLEPNVGTAAATIARAIATVRQAGDIENRLAALEAASAKGVTA